MAENRGGKGGPAEIRKKQSDVRTRVTKRVQWGAWGKKNAKKDLGWQTCVTKGCVKGANVGVEKKNKVNTKKGKAEKGKQLLDQQQSSRWGEKVKNVRKARDMSGRRTSR